MATATTDAAVRALLANPDPSADYTFALESAEDLVESVLASKGLSDVKMELIKRWMSAHFVEVRTARLKRDQVRTAQGDIITQSDLGFDVTHYGQQAMRLDTTGELAKINNRTKTEGTTKPVIEKRTVGLQWLGRRRRCP